MFSKILIANRGEIACRIIKTAKRMGVKTVAVYSDADAKALHVKMADEAIHIGASPASQSYLKVDTIIAAAKQSGAQAIHPGYGFLSENPEFAEKIAAAGMVFIGPSADSIRKMGLKDEAKRLMEAANVPVVPGYHGAEQDVDFLASEAKKIGYPILIKARAGGGGKGIRLVEKSENFAEALGSAQSEGKASFGDSHVIIEKYILSPRHIEVQIFGDTHGNVVHLFERDCSMQRRHQKVIEEAPAPDMPENVRKAMTQAAVKAAKKINYHGAGTIEFIVDGAGKLRVDGFWFMEMNTRLQVEHPVTEAITGQDLVEWQLRVAYGEKLPLEQKEIKIEGHAFEARIYAEDPSEDFKPAPGKLVGLKFAGNARIDTGVESGDEISPYYDPMIAKITTHGATRENALNKMKENLDQTFCAGTSNNIGFLRRLANHKDFVRGKVDTGLIGRNIDCLGNFPAPTVCDFFTATIIGHAVDLKSPLLGWSLWQKPELKFELEYLTELIFINIEAMGEGVFNLIIGEEVATLSNIQIDGCILHATIKGETHSAHYLRDGRSIYVKSNADLYEFNIRDALDVSSNSANSSNQLIAPMTGTITKLNVRVGDKVSIDDPLLTLEAMKLENILKAPREGVIAEINCVQSDAVSEGAILITFEEIQQAPNKEES